MVIDDKLIDEIEQEAKASPRLRANCCLHKSPHSKVQKMVNVLLPGTEMSIHRHLSTDETLILLRGSIQITYHNEEGMETDRFLLSKNGNYAIDIPKGQWHNIIVEEPVALMEIKGGPYKPLTLEEILK